MNEISPSLRGNSFLSLSLFLLTSLSLFLLPPATSSPSSSSLPIIGKGSTLAFRFMNSTLFAYSLSSPPPPFPITFTPTSSGNGRSSLMTEVVDFSNTDVPFSASDHLVYPRDSDIIAFPILAASIVIIYNLPSIPYAIPLVFDLPTLAQIFSGNLTMWNDERILSLNPLVSMELPNQRISVIARSDNSGTSTVFCNTLGSISPTIQRGISNQTNCYSDGGGSHFSFPTTKYSQNEGVADGVAATPFSLSYSVLNYATERGLSYANLINSAGILVSPSPQNLLFPQLSYVTSQTGSPSSPTVSATQTFNIYNSPALSGWPISTFSFVAIRLNTTRSGSGCYQRKALVDYLIWLLTSPSVSTVASNHFFSQINFDFVSALHLVEILQTEVKCADGSNAYEYTDTSTEAVESIVGNGMNTVDLIMSLLISSYQVIDSAAEASSSSSSSLSQYSSTHYYSPQSPSSSITSLLSIPSSPSISSLSLYSTLLSSSIPPFSLPSSEFFTIPFMAIPVVIIMNPNTFNNTLSYPLFINMNTLIGIFTGRISYWNDSAITALNPHLPLSSFPFLPILIVVSNDKIYVETTAILVRSMISYGNANGVNGENPFTSCYNVMGNSGSEDMSIKEWNWTISSSSPSSTCGNPNFLFVSLESKIQGNVAITPNAIGFTSLTSSIESKIFTLINNNYDTNSNANFNGNVNALISSLDSQSYQLIPGFPDLSPCIVSQLSQWQNDHSDEENNILFYQRNSGSGGYNETPPNPDSTNIPIISDDFITNSLLSQSPPTLSSSFVLSTGISSLSPYQCYPLFGLVSLVIPRSFTSAQSGGIGCPSSLPSVNYVEYLVSNSQLPVVQSQLSSLGVYVFSSSVETSVGKFLIDNTLCDGSLLLYEPLQQFSLPSALIVFSLVSCILICVILFITMFIVHTYRNTKVIKSSSSLFLLLQLVGLIIFIATLPTLLTSNPTERSCDGALWLFSLGFSLNFVPLLARNYRIYRIFTSGAKSLRLIKLTNNKLMTYVIFGILLNILILFAWEMVNSVDPNYRFLPMEYHYTMTNPDTLRNYDALIPYCAISLSSSSTHIIFPVLLGSYIILILLVGCLLSFSVRSVDNEYNESTLIARKIYTFSLSLIVAVATISTNVVEGTFVYSVLMIFFVWTTASSYIITFGPKVMILFPLISFHFWRFIRRKSRKISKIMRRAWRKCYVCMMCKKEGEEDVGDKEDGRENEREKEREMDLEGKVSPKDKKMGSPQLSMKNNPNAPHTHSPLNSPMKHRSKSKSKNINNPNNNNNNNPHNDDDDDDHPDDNDRLDVDGDDDVRINENDPAIADPKNLGSRHSTSSSPSSHPSGSQGVSNFHDFEIISPDDLNFLNLRTLNNYLETLELYYRLVKSTVATKKILLGGNGNNNVGMIGAVPRGNVSMVNQSMMGNGNQSHYHNTSPPNKNKSINTVTPTHLMGKERTALSPGRRAGSIGNGNGNGTANSNGTGSGQGTSFSNYHSAHYQGTGTLRNTSTLSHNNNMVRISGEGGNANGSGSDANITTIGNAFSTTNTTTISSSLTNVNSTGMASGTKWKPSLGVRGKSRTANSNEMKMENENAMDKGTEKETGKEMRADMISSSFSSSSDHVTEIQNPHGNTNGNTQTEVHFFSPSPSPLGSSSASSSSGSSSASSSASPSPQLSNRQSNLIEKEKERSPVPSPSSRTNNYVSNANPMTVSVPAISFVNPRVSVTVTPLTSQRDNGLSPLGSPPSFVPGSIDN